MPLAEFRTVEASKSNIGLQNTGAAHIGISGFTTINAKIGQLLVVYKENIDNSAGLTGGKIYLVSDIDPDPENINAGNISLPANKSAVDTASDGYDELELKHTKFFLTTPALYRVTQTFATLIWTGITWSVISTAETIYYTTS